MATIEASNLGSSSPALAMTESGGRVLPPALQSILIFLGISAIELVLILRATGGHFIYCLDDPYIHLTLARNIAHGHYGLNMAEVSAPSSSVLWPFLLILGAGTRWHIYVPLVLNLISGCGAAALLGAFAALWPWPQEGKSVRWKRPATTALLVVAANLVGLTFTGMEHVLQVFLTLVCAQGMWFAWEGKRVPWWCIASAIVLPGVRYEGLAITFAVGVVLFGQRRRIASICTVLASLAMPLALGLFLMAHHLSPLPSSVLAKGGMFRSVHPGLLFDAITNVMDDIRDPSRWPFDFLFLILLELLWRKRQERSKAWVLAAAACAVLLQLLIGRYGWFYRYEVYAKIFAVVIIFIAVSSYKKLPWRYVVALLAVCANPYLLAIYHVPMAAAEVYQQQYQMARFETDYYRKSVAINDIGLVGFNLPPHAYLLDLYGLASQESLHQRVKDAAWLDAITRLHDVGLAMIYPEWFTSIPSDWTPVAELLLGLPDITLGGTRVVFYRTPAGDLPKIESELKDFKATLPPGATLKTDGLEHIPVVVAPLY